MSFFDNAEKKIINIGRGSDCLYGVYHVEIVTKLDHKSNNIYFIRYVNLFDVRHNNIMNSGYHMTTDFCYDFNFLNSINREYNYNIIYYHQNKYNSLCNLYEIEDEHDFFESIITKKDGFGIKMGFLNDFWDYLYDEYECKSEDAVFKHTIFENVSDELINYIRNYFYFTENITTKSLLSLNNIAYFCKNRYIYGCNASSDGENGEINYGWKHYLQFENFEDYFNLKELKKKKYDDYEKNTSYLFDTNDINDINENDK
jgi:hypothetical protein